MTTDTRSAHTILYSVQQTSTVTTWKRVQKSYASWDAVDPNWRPIYTVMCTAMRTHDIAIADHPPIWAWAEPKETIAVLAADLLSSADWEHDISAVELSVPTANVLCSSYTVWNNMIDTYLETGILPDETMLRTTRCDALQAALPYIDRNWIRTTHPLTQPPEYTEM